MAERRMFAKTIIDSDAFLEMPISARLLYYDLAMRADDDGFINSPKKIMKFVGATNDDMNILILRKFIIPFDNGVVVIKHWRIHNYIRKDTYNETSYREQKAMLELDENKAYRMANFDAVDGSLTQVRLGKDSIDKYSNKPPLSPLEGETKEKTSKTDYIQMIRDRQFDKSLEDVIIEWYRYKTEKRQAYKPTGFSKFLTEVQNNVMKYGVDAVVEVVNVSMANNWQGIIWDKLKNNGNQLKKSSSDVLSKYLNGGKQ